MPTAGQLAEQLDNCEDRVARERLERAYQRRLSLNSMITDSGERLAMPRSAPPYRVQLSRRG